MINDNAVIKVRNLTGHTVVYRIPEDNIRRAFGKNETKNITAGELRKLFFQNGGGILLKEFLYVDNEELALEFGVSEDALQHEYSWTEKDVDNLLLHGDINVLKDALDFAPLGIVETIIDRAVALRIPDNNKREAIHEMTKRDITGMINNQLELEKVLGEKPQQEHRSRRVNNINNTTNKGRRV